MKNFDPVTGCGTAAHVNRRTLLKAAGLSGIGWLTPVAEQLARAAEKDPSGKKPKSVIVLWLAGAPSQLETFDPHPGTVIAGGTKARNTSVKGIQLAEGMEQVADQMEHIAIVRSVMSKEGDHERATYNMKTGFRPDPTLVHPAIGAVLCKNLTDPKPVEIPRHVSILPGQFPARGGYLGDKFDAFKINDPINPIPDVRAQVDDNRFKKRVEKLDFLEKEFARGRILASRNKSLDKDKTLHVLTTKSALRMMESDQLKAFEVSEEPQSVRDEFGDTPFGRGCLAALRLIETGVRCIEVTLNGWDSHARNHEIQAGRIEILDPAFAALVRHLRERDLLDSTIVMCGGEFGRTPQINGAGGRDHWPHGFSIALAGGGIRGGHVIGATSPKPVYDEKDRLKDVENPYNVEDIHATILHSLGIDFTFEEDTPVGRPMAISKGKVIEELLPNNA